MFGHTNPRTDISKHCLILKMAMCRCYYNIFELLHIAYICDHYILLLLHPVYTSTPVASTAHLTFLKTITNKVCLHVDSIYGKSLNNACGWSGGAAASIRLLLTKTPFPSIAQVPGCTRSRLNGSRDPGSLEC